MGADNHSTTQPENHELPMQTRRDNLVNDLSDVDCVSDVSVHEGARNAVLFECEGSMPGDIPNSVIRVLAEHDAFLPHPQPDDRRENWALIELD
jgi:hypothetical protein